MSTGLTEIHDRLLAAYGPQTWWPAETPFEVLIGAVLTQNTAWRNVERAIDNLREAGMLDAAAIDAAEIGRLKTLIRPAGFFNQKAERLRILARFYLDRGGIDPLRAAPPDELRRELLSLHGIGPETADSILLYAAHRPVFVVDAYTRRIFSRLGRIEASADYGAIQARFESELPREASLFNEYHALIVEHAKRHCRTTPRCDGCPLRDTCPSAHP